MLRRCGEAVYVLRVLPGEGGLQGRAAESGGGGRGGGGEKFKKEGRSAGPDKGSREPVGAPAGHAHSRGEGDRGGVQGGGRLQCPHAGLLAAQPPPRRAHRHQRTQIPRQTHGHRRGLLPDAEARGPRGGAEDTRVLSKPAPGAAAGDQSAPPAAGLQLHTHSGGLQGSRSERLFRHRAPPHELPAPSGDSRALHRADGALGGVSERDTASEHPTLYAQLLQEILQEREDPPARSDAPAARVHRPGASGACVRPARRKHRHPVYPAPPLQRPHRLTGYTVPRPRGPEPPPLYGAAAAEERRGAGGGGAQARVQRRPHPAGGAEAAADNRQDLPGLEADQRSARGLAVHLPGNQPRRRAGAQPTRGVPKPRLGYRGHALSPPIGQAENRGIETGPVESADRALRCLDASVSEGVYGSIRHGAGAVDQHGAAQGLLRASLHSGHAAPVGRGARGVVPARARVRAGERGEDRGHGEDGAGDAAQRGAEEEDGAEGPECGRLQRRGAGDGQGGVRERRADHQRVPADQGRGRGGDAAGHRVREKNLSRE
mmetsp:Transcript_32166/g.70872  ORF Transcript_32166/g.70872 Transcript_32166/m.70872 type:complete len:545 (-) Transcript_32166:15-1649(-)